MSTPETERLIFVVIYPVTGQFLQGPRDPKKVKRDGYGFTDDKDDAWTFATEKAASAKARIVDRHMGWGDWVLVVSNQTQPA